MPPFVCNEATMNEHERRLKIWELVEERGSVLVNELAQHFRVSKVTIRSDLEQLEKNGLGHRFRGGLTRNSNSITSVKTDVVPERSDENADLIKQSIAKKALGHIKDYDNIILGSGTTNVKLAEVIAGSSLKGLTIITNNLMAITSLCQNKDISLIVLGGRYTHGNSSTYGAEAERSVEGMKVDVMFTGADGVDETGVTSMHEGFSLSATLSKYSRKVVVITESFKLGRRKHCKVLPLSEIDVIITNSVDVSDLDASIKNKLEFAE